MKLDFPTLGKPVMSSVRVFGSMDGKRDRCCRTCSKYVKLCPCLFMIVHILKCKWRYWIFTCFTKSFFQELKKKWNLKKSRTFLSVFSFTFFRKAVHALCLFKFRRESLLHLKWKKSEKKVLLPSEGSPFQLFTSVQGVSIFQKSNIILGNAAIIDVLIILMNGEKT